MNKEENPSDTLAIPIRRFITKRLIAVEQETSIRDAAARMVEFEISSLGVLKNGKVIGIVTDTDLKKRALSRGVSPDKTVHEIMTPDPITADINATVRDVLQLMSEEKIKHIFVTDQEEVVGVATVKDLEDIDLQGLETLISRD